MQVVCKDTEANGQPSMWFYDAGKYSRRDEAGDIKAIINGKEIPDPSALWDSRCQAAGATSGSVQVLNQKTGQTVRLKPTEATFALFNHWQGVQSCRP